MCIYALEHVYCFKIFSGVLSATLKRANSTIELKVLELVCNFMLTLY